jgi:uncharacterized protein involved in exopolysaccharide biosynthesis
MFLRPILEMLWARRLIVLTATASCLAGGTYVVLTSTPRYQATARVELDYLKPNPVTGSFVTSKTVTTYVNSQLEMVRDYQVAIPAAEALGLLDNPDLQAQFAADPNANPDGFPRWVAARIIGNTGVRPISDSNILEISHAATTADSALEVVEAVRAAYVQASVDARRSSALGGATNLAAQADRTRAELAKLEAAKREWENQHGIMPVMDARRLTNLVTSVTGLYVSEAPDIPSSGRLAAAEAELEHATGTLGPNHPRLQTLRAARDMLKAQVDRERAFEASVGASAGLNERAKQAAIDLQKEKVLAQRQEVLALRLIQDQIDGREGVLEALNTRIAELRQLTSLREADVVPLGDPEVKPEPVFPNPWLIFGGTGVLGLVVGSLLALFVELLNRRARSARDLEASVGAPLLGMVPALANEPRRGRPTMSLRRAVRSSRRGRWGKAAA